MAMPSSGVLKWSAIQTEFGGTNPVKLSEYYGESTLPTSGLIKASDFYGTSSIIVWDKNTQNFTAPADGTLREQRDTALQTLLSGVAVGDINVTKAVFNTTGTYMSCRDGSNNSSSESRYFYFGGPSGSAFGQYTASSILTASPNTCQEYTDSHTRDLQNFYASSMPQWVKDGCPIWHNGFNPQADGVNGYPSMSAMYVDLEFTTT